MPGSASATTPPLHPWRECPIGVAASQARASTFLPCDPAPAWGGAGKGRAVSLVPGTTGLARAGLRLEAGGRFAALPPLPSCGRDSEWGVCGAADPECEDPVPVLPARRPPLEAGSGSRRRFGRAARRQLDSASPAGRCRNTLVTRVVTMQAPPGSSGAAWPPRGAEALCALP